ncbi:hypothetical protein JTB14_008209 [Gonioctena quinquepunctata]|nr:hypothetical protein JTB14_008209 [Gonioctena quinquepunctata]
MSRGQAGPRICVPDELREILLEFTISYLLEQPGDVVSYAAEYFTQLRQARTTSILYDETRSAEEPLSPDESTISREEEPPVGRFSGRRKSVFAETYDPEEDEDDDEGPKQIFPKSDEQRQRLARRSRTYCCSAH